MIDMGSFVYISVCALLCYLFLFITFLFAQRSKLINAFLLALAALIAWCGCSVLMRKKLAKLGASVEIHSRRGVGYSLEVKK